jgi:preprotein translocase subunit SecY
MEENDWVDSRLGIGMAIAFIIIANVISFILSAAVALLLYIIVGIAFTFKTILFIWIIMTILNLIICFCVTFFDK